MLFGHQSVCGRVGWKPGLGEEEQCAIFWNVFWLVDWNPKEKYCNILPHVCLIRILFQKLWLSLSKKAAFLQKVDWKKWSMWSTGYVGFEINLCSCLNSLLVSKILRVHLETFGCFNCRIKTLTEPYNLVLLPWAFPTGFSMFGSHWWTSRKICCLLL